MDVPSFPPQVKIYEWASYCADRKPQFKMHQGRGQAMNAIMYTIHKGPRGGVIYHHEGGEWVPVFAYEYDETCVECGKKGQLRSGGRPEIGGFLTEVATSLITKKGNRATIPKRLRKTVHYGCRDAYRRKHPEKEWAWQSDDSRFDLNTLLTPTTK